MNMFKRPTTLACAAIILAAIALLCLPGSASRQAKVVVSSLFVPLFGLSSASLAISESATESLLPRKHLLHQLHTLKQQNAELRAASLQAQALTQENNALRDALAWQKITPWKTRLARVVGRDPANWWRMIHIDVGSRDGLRPNLAVVTPDGLVGKILETSPSSSRVALIGDPNCRVSAQILETRDNTGIINMAAPGGSDYQLVDLTYLPNNPQINSGQTVATSGLGGIFPKGLLVGRIVDLRSVGNGLYQEARVRLAANLNQLEVVFVILP